jgi:hypothetical protein
MKFDLTNDEIDIILDLIDDQLDEFKYWNEDFDHPKLSDISALQYLKTKLENP